MMKTESCLLAVIEHGSRQLGDCTCVQRTGRRLWRDGGPTLVVVVAKLRTSRTTVQETLARWWSDTGGGGGGEVENFQNYCPIREKWLTYIYMLDVEASLLLAPNASLAVPKQELVHESGYEQESARPGRTSNSATKQLKNGAALIQATEECSKNINRVSDLITTLVEKRISASNSVTLTPATISSTPPFIPHIVRLSLCHLCLHWPPPLLCTHLNNSDTMCILKMPPHPHKAACHFPGNHCYGFVLRDACAEDIACLRN